MKKSLLMVILLFAWNHKTFALSCENKWDALQRMNPVNSFETYQVETKVIRNDREKITRVQEKRTVLEIIPDRIKYLIESSNENGAQRSSYEFKYRDSFIMKCEDGHSSFGQLIREGQEIVQTPAGSFNCHYGVYQSDEYSIITLYTTLIDGYELQVQEVTKTDMPLIHLLMTRILLNRGH